jgi:hypothetical protein
MSATARVSDPGTHWTAGDPARLARLIRLRAVRMVAPHDAAWAALGRTGHVPVAEVAPAEDGEHAPV